MTILFDACALVKSARPFGRGILRSAPVYRAPYSAADLAWLAEDNARREAENRRYDALAAEAHALSLMEEGIACL